MTGEDNRADPVSPAPGLCAEHPSRAALGTCARCGNYYCEQCASRREGAEGLCRSCDESRRYVPFEDPALGFWAGYFATLKRSVVELPRFAAELPSRGGYGRPLWFAFWPTALTTLVGTALLVGFVLAIGLPLSDGEAKVHPGVIGAAMAATYVVMGIGGYLVYLALWPLALLGSARMFGCRGLTHEGLFRILCYASGFNFLYFVPMLGLAAALYHLVVSIVCVAAQARTSGLTAVGIVGAPALLFGGCCCGGYVLLILLGMQQ